MAPGADDQLPRDLGAGLRLRRATPADTERLVAFNRRTHSWSPAAPLQEEMAIWTRDLLDGAHPTTGPADFTVVEEVASGAIVSTLCLIGQEWSYDGITFPVGRVELVGTDPGYRRRGLVRAQMDDVHGWSAARGDLAQAITGIPWYYRQFGYELALDLDGGRVGPLAGFPPPDAAVEEPFTLRPATSADAPFLRRTYDAGMARFAVAARRDEAQWRYELTGRRAGGIYKRDLWIVAARDGEAAGLLATWPFLLEGSLLLVESCELRAGVAWEAAMPGILRGLRALAGRYAARADGADPPGGRCAFLLGAQHPAYAAAGAALPDERRPYAWYLRVPDLPRFVRQIAPALERRLAASPHAGYSGELRISRYRDGLRLAFAGGRLTEAARWQPTAEDGGDCAFPDLTFLHLLFGHRSLADVRHLFADCWASKTAAALLDALFPPLPSAVWGLA